jgi:hypothetical protein
MIAFKSCSRCRGDVYLDCDLYGWFVKCLQCGYQRDLPAGLAPVPVPAPQAAPDNGAEEPLRRAV